MEKKYVAFGATLALSTAGLLIALLPMDVGGPAAGAEQDAAAVSRAELRVSVSTGSQLQFGDPAQTGRRAVGVSGGEGREPDGAHTHAPTQPDGGRVQAGRSRPRYHILVPWGRQRVSATTPLPTAETCAVLREADCVFEHRDDWSGPPGSPSDKQLALARADLVMIDTNTKMKDDKRYYDVEANPLHKTLGVLNIENVWGRMPAWLSKWKVRWFGRANETAWWDRFAVVVSFEEHAIIPYRYWHAANRDLFLKHKRTRLADKNLRSAAFIASNCWTRFQTTSGFDRDAEVRNLSQVFPVEPLGACGAKSKENGKVPAAASAKLFNRFGCAAAKPNQKPCIISRYAFFLSFENSRSPDYVTEKLYEPLLAGSIPVYLGAPNVENFAPAAHCLVKVDHFPTYSILADYLNCVLDHPSVYEYYTTWSNRPSLPSFARLTDTNEYPLCKACTLLARNHPVLHNVTARLARPHPAHFSRRVADSQLPFSMCLPDKYKHIGVPFPP